MWFGEKAVNNLSRVITSALREIVSESPQQSLRNDDVGNGMQQ